MTSESPTLASALSGVGQLLAGRYRVLAQLGRGATKEVYLAHDERLDRDVALAIVVGAGTSDTARARVAREAQITGRLGDHRHVITVYDTGDVDGVPYLVLRAMRGGSLADLLERGQPSRAQALRYGSEIASALGHAHEHGIVHRDVKPDNVWLAADGSVALGDFGVAHQLGSERLTAAGVVVGTLRYLSPEQIRGDSIGPASDVYALGVTLYELVTGVAPFRSTDPTALLTQHLTMAPVAPSRHDPTVPPQVDRLIMALLAKQPDQRPSAAATVAAELAAMADGLHARADAAATSDTLPSHGGVATRRRPEQTTADPRRADERGARRQVAVLAARADIGDPETMHGVLDGCGAIVARHGGTIERQLGDMLVAFFGLVEAHDDDALRAARAAVELRDADPRLCLGVEAGEVFHAQRAGATIATGGPISAAGRLAANAAAGEILLGQAIRPAVAETATIDRRRGRLLTLVAQQPGLLREPRTPFVGRQQQLEQLHATFADATATRSCRLVTVVGPAGIGKSRLAGKFLAEIAGSATVLAGRCQSYGEGTTFRALAEIVRGLGDDPRARIEQLLADDEQSVRGILGAVGLAAEPAQVEETSWGMRRLFERLACDRPLIVAVEDVHWAQPALLDVIDHVAALTRDAPILLLCLSRPELLDERPAWGVPRADRRTIALDALADEQAEQLAIRLGATAHAAQIARRAEGNPLFVEQLVAVGDTSAASKLPASIQAVLAARIDRLDAVQQLVLRHAAVEGRTFHADALAQLLPAGERGGVRACIVALAGHGLVGPDRPEFAGEDAFRFTHALIREAAYAGIPKLVRADLHATLAQWLERRAAADEIVAHHLEQACLLPTQLGRAGERERALASRAVRRLEAAARSALGRGDPAAGVALLERAVVLAAVDPTARGGLLPALGASLFEAGRMTEATRVLDEAIALALEPRLEARARVERAFVGLEAETSVGTEHARRVADDAQAVLERESDDYGQARLWCLRAQLAWTAGQVQRADDAWQLAADCADRAADERVLFDIYGWRATAAVLGPTPVAAAIARCEQLLELVAASPVARVWMINPLASLHAMRGDAALADRLLGEANEILRELGDLGSSVSHHEAIVRMLAGQPAAAEAALRAGIARLSAMSDGGLLATTTAMLAQAVFAAGRPGEAAGLCETSAQAASADDIVTQVIWRGVKAKVLAVRGEHAAAARLAREAVALVEPTDLLTNHADALLDLATVLELGGRLRAGERAVAAALALLRRKGNATAAARARTRRIGERAGAVRQG